MRESRQDFKHNLSTRVSEQIEKANQRLRNSRLGVTIAQKGSRLHLIATLPPKPNSRKTANHQQRISLGVMANLAGVATAEAEAKKVGGQIATRSFTWEPYLRGANRKPETVSDWFQRFEAEFRASVAPVTWKTDYANPCKKLPQDKPLTADLLRTVLEQTQKDSKTRRRTALAFHRLGQFAGLECDLRQLVGSYSATAVEPRSLPTDIEIEKHFDAITNPGWRWVYGMIAAFGLRSHEVFFLDTEEMEAGRSQMVFVREGKTGPRMVWACYPEWIERFQLRDRKRPKIKEGLEHVQYTSKTSKYFKEGLNLPFTALDLRHRWAVRTLEFGLPYELAAKQMGHSTAVHERTYHRWITAETHQRAYDALTQRADRPRAPGHRLPAAHATGTADPEEHNEDSYSANDGPSSVGGEASGAVGAAIPGESQRPRFLSSLS